MTTFATSSLTSLRRGIGTQLLMVGVFLAGTLLIMPLSLFVYDNDEGINVIKAVLMADGYPLYTQTWSDQPPIFTQLLEFVFALFGEQMVVARLFVLAMTALFVWAYTATIQMQLGEVAAWTALLLLMLSDNFMRLSVSVMIGLPALSFAMVGIYLLQRYKVYQGEGDHQGEGRTRSRRWLLLLAGLCMALAMQTKLFTAVLIPILGLDLLDYGWKLWEDPEALRRKVVDLLLWGTVTVATYLLIGFYYHAFDLGMLLGSHLSGTVQSAYEDESSWGELQSFLLYDYGHLLLAALGLMAVVIRRNWRGLLPLGWLALAFLLLLNHRPIWYHHYQLLSIPLCWLAAYPVWALVDQERWKGAIRRGKAELYVAAGTVAILLLLGLIYLRGEQSVPYYNQRVYDQQIVDLLSADAAQTNWVFSDRATYPFYAGLRVPPEIAVFSRKRFFGENLDTQILLNVMQRYHPEQVLLTRFKDELLVDAGFAGYLNAHYTKVQEDPDYVYYRLQ